MEATAWRLIGCMVCLEWSLTSSKVARSRPWRCGNLSQVFWELVNVHNPRILESGGRRAFFYLIDTQVDAWPYISKEIRLGDGE